MITMSIILDDYDYDHVHKDERVHKDEYDLHLTWPWSL